MPRKAVKLTKGSLRIRIAGRESFLSGEPEVRFDIVTRDGGEYSASYEAREARELAYSIRHQLVRPREVVRVLLEYVAGPGSLAILLTPEKAGRLADLILGNAWGRCPSCARSMRDECHEPLCRRCEFDRAMEKDE